MIEKASQELKPCPLCGKSESLEFDHYDEIWYILCNAKKGGCGTTSGGYENKSEVVDLWENRP